MTRNVFALWVFATLLLVPLTLIERGPVLQAAGMGAVGSGVGAACLYGWRAKPRPLLRAGVAVAIFCALIWLGYLTR